MLIRRVLSSRHAWRLLLRVKRSSQPVGPHPSTRHGWFRLPPIDQYSSLLPPVGVWAVSQSQCGGSLGRVSVPVWGANLSVPLGIVATVGRYPAVQLMPREPIRHRQKGFHAPAMQLVHICGISPDFSGLSPCAGHVAHALRTLAPVAARKYCYFPRCPSTCMC